jgi:hypothetical protein
VLWVISPVTYYCPVQTFLGAKRMECVELAGAFAKGKRSDSASKLEALHTLRDIRMPSPVNVTVLTTARTKLIITHKLGIRCQCCSFRESVPAAGG